MHEPQCDLCGSSKAAPYLKSRDYLNGLPGEFSVLRCTVCGLMYTSPRPDQDEMSSYYPPSTPYFNPGPDARKPRKETSGINRVLLEQFRDYGKGSAALALALYPLYLMRRHKLMYEAVPKFVQGGRLLEVGCSYGKFLHGMQSLGWSQVEGIELNAGAAAAGRELFGLDIKVSSLEQAGLARGRYDAIVLKMVLEHLYSPMAALSMMHEALKPGGQLIITVPDIGGVEARAFGPHFYGLQLPTHLYHFTPATLAACLGKAGFSVTGVYHNTNDRDLTGSIENMAKDGPVPLWARVMGSKPMRKSVVQHLMKPLAAAHRTSRMTVHAIKPACKAEGMG